MIDVKGFIKQHKLDKRRVAHALYPKNRYPTHAMARIYNGKSLLDSDQIFKLAAMAGVSILDLFYPNEEWTAKEGEDFYTVETRDFMARLDLKTWKTTVYHKSTLIYENVVSQPTITLAEYLKSVEGIVTAHELI